MYISTAINKQTELIINNLKIEYDRAVFDVDSSEKKGVKLNYNENISSQKRYNKLSFSFKYLIICR